MIAIINARQLERIYVGQEGLFSLLSPPSCKMNSLTRIQAERGIKLDDVKLGLAPFLVADILRQRKTNAQQPWQSPIAQQAFQDLLAEAENRSDDHVVIHGTTFGTKVNSGAFELQNPIPQ